MPRLFGRRTALTVGNVRVAEYLNVAFVVARSLRRDPNRLTARIYNLNENTRAAIESFDKAVRVSFEAGYKTTQLAEIFRGNFVTAYTQRSSADLITTVEASDGGEGQFANHVKSYTKGTSLRAVVDDLVAKAKIDPGNLAEAFDKYRDLGGATLVLGKVVRGNAFDSLALLLNGIGYSVSLQNNQLQILKNNASLPGRAVLLNERTGLIGTPSITIDQVTKTKRVRCESLMNTDIAPGKQVKIDNVTTVSHFTVERAEYRGGLRENDFGVAMEGPVIS